jgi:anti-sigma factor RsiW
MKPDDEELSALIRRAATRYRADDPLRANVRTQLALAEAGRAAKSSAAGHWWRSMGWRPALVGFALGVMATVSIGPLWRMQSDRTLEAELVSVHVHALRFGPLTEVASSDRHTVKPWFQGRLDYAPPVFDLAEDGFPLLGGRVEHVRDQTVAALTYKRDQHVIHLFVWPASDRATLQRQERRGFNVVHWADGSMQYWAISDLNRGDLERFARTWLTKAAGP